jgi:predicted DNA-binding transcriptional regulator YafY
MYFCETRRMRASRLLSILMLLQARGRMSAQALADAVEVSVRTVYRDVDQLSAAGVPVWAERGRAGGFQLQPGWQTRLTGLTEPEARALLMAGLPGPAAQLGLGGAARSAQHKLLAALPAALQADALRVGARFHLDPHDWFSDNPPSEHLAVVAEAVWSERRLAIRYESWNGVGDRSVEPLGLVLKAGAWYMAARTGPREPARTYRLSSVHAATLLPQRFRRPLRFDLPAYWHDATQRFEAGLYVGTARLRVSPRGYRWLQQWAPAVAAAAARTRADEGRGSDWLRVEVPIESIAHATQQMLRLGAEGEVLAPAALRTSVLETARRMVQRHAGASRRAPA